MKNISTLLCFPVVILLFFSSCSSSKLACPTFTNGGNTAVALKNEKTGRKEATAWKKTGKQTLPPPVAVAKPEAQPPAKTATALPTNNNGNSSLPPQNAFAATNDYNAGLTAATAPPPVYAPAAYTRCCCFGVAGKTAFCRNKAVPAIEKVCTAISTILSSAARRFNKQYSRQTNARGRKNR